MQYSTEAAGGNDAVISEVCNLMLPGFTAPKNLWLKRHKPRRSRSFRYIMLPHDYLNFLLTGIMLPSAETLGHSLSMAFAGNGPKRFVTRDPGLIKLLPDLIESGKPAGKSPGKPPPGLASRRHSCFLRRRRQHDGRIGTGTVRDGFLTMIWNPGTLYGYSDSPVSDPEKGLFRFSSSTGGYLPLLCTMNCTVATEETRKLFGLGVKEFDECASKAPIGSEGVVFLPFFNGERTPNLPNGRASINGLNAANSSRENIARAAMESAIFGMRIGLEAFQALGFRAKEIRLIGGGAKSKIWRSIAANVMDLPVKLPASDEAAAMGGAVQALWCLMNLEGNKISIGELTDEHITINEDQCINPDPASVAAYNKAYAEYNRYLGALAPLYT